VPVIDFPLLELRHEQTIRHLSGLTAKGVLDALLAACDRDVLAEVATRVREYLDHSGGGEMVAARPKNAPAAFSESARGVKSPVETLSKSARGA
jgi:hypothetical protein